MKKFILLLSILSTTAIAAPDTPGVCDINNDGIINKDDIMLITLARGTTVPPMPEVYDLNGDGYVTVNDARGCVLRCTNSKCL